MRAMLHHPAPALRRCFDAPRRPPRLNPMHFWLACYFVLACVIAAGVLLPDWRASIAQQLRGGVSRAAVWLRRASARQQSLGSGAARSVLQLLQGGLRWLSRRGHLMLAALAVVALPVLIALALQRWNRIEGFDDGFTKAFNANNVVFGKNIGGRFDTIFLFLMVCWLQNVFLISTNKIADVFINVVFALPQTVVHDIY